MNVFWKHLNSDLRESKEKQKLGSAFMNAVVVASPELKIMAMLADIADPPYNTFAPVRSFFQYLLNVSIGQHTVYGWIQESRIEYSDLIAAEYDDPTAQRVDDIICAYEASR